MLFYLFTALALVAVGNFQKSENITGAILGNSRKEALLFTNS